MSIVIDSTLALNNTTQSTSHSVSFNNVAGDFLIVAIIEQNSFSGNPVTSITYNGVSLTLVDFQEAPNTQGAGVWRLANPATGTNTLTINFSNNGPLYGAVQTYTGVDLASPIDATNKGTSWNIGTSMSLPITTVSDNATLFASAYIARNVTTYGANTTQVAYTAGTFLVVRSTNAITSAGATTLSWTANSTEFLAYVIVALKPDTGGGANTTNFFLMM